MTGPYRTVTIEALLAIAGLMSIDGMVEGRKKLTGKELHDIWCREWNEPTGKAQWIKEIIQNLKVLLNSEINFVITQFKDYLNRFPRTL